MANIVPSIVCEYVDKAFPWARDQKDEDRATQTLGRNAGPQLRGLVELVERIPAHLIQLDGGKTAVLFVSVTAIKDALKRWEGGHSGDVCVVQGFGWLNPVAHIRRLLAECPDDSPHPGTVELEFVSDLQLQANLRTDLSSATRALEDGNWKAATVLAGAVVEALLLDALLPIPRASVDAAVKTLGTEQPEGLARKPDSDLRYWDPEAYVKVARQLKIIAADTATQCLLAKDFRNLIHPGRELRTQRPCSRGAALAAIAAVELTVQELRERARPSATA